MAASKAQQDLEIEVRMLRETNRIYQEAIATIASSPIGSTRSAVELSQIARRAIQDAALLLARERP
jgi:hypothetical protein